MSALLRTGGRTLGREVSIIASPSASGAVPLVRYHSSRVPAVDVLPLKCDRFLVEADTKVSDNMKQSRFN
jgi:hypothetical protein